jgi:predicted metalloprotease
MGGGLAIGGGIIGVIALVLNFLLGGDPSDIPQLNQNTQQELTPEQAAAEDEMAQFVSVVLAENEEVWHRLMADYNKNYQEPRLVLFRGATESGCGNAQSATGPFYCPLDSKVYIDLTFFEELKSRFQAPGDFAMAYVIAHEVGHHVQNLLGVTDKMAQLRQQVSEKEYNKYSVMLELQADFYAGVWAHHAHHTNAIVEPGDIEEALNAANAIGDDRLQKQSQGHVVPDAFTHGTSEQRMYWFKKGFETGDLRQGNTFQDPSLN